MDDVKVRLSPEGIKEVTEALKKLQRDAGAASRAGASGVSALTGSLGALKRLLPTLGFAAVVSALVGFGKSAISSAADLDDLAEKTGASVENLSKLEQQARISGVQLSTVETALVRLAKGIAGTDEEASGAARALQALGLRAEELRGKDTAESLRIVAGRLAQFRDGATKTALAMEIFGKSGAEVLPFLKDLANDGELAANVTAKQAAEAEELGKSWRRLVNDARTLGQSIALGIIPFFRDMLEQMREGIRIAGGFGAALRLFGLSTITTENAGAKIAELTTELLRLQQILDNPPRGAGTAMLDRVRKQAEDIKKQIEFAQFLQRQALRDQPNQDTPGERARFGLGGRLLEFERQNAKERLAVDKARFDALLALEAQYAGVAIRNRQQIAATEKAVADQLKKSADLRRDLATAQLPPAQQVEAKRVQAVDVEAELRAAALAGNAKDAIAAHEKLIALVKELKAAGDQGGEALLGTADELLKLAQSAEKLKLGDEAKKADEAAKAVRAQLAPLRAEIEKLADQIEPVNVKLRLAEGEVRNLADELAKQFFPINVTPQVKQFSQGGAVPRLAAGGRVPGHSPSPHADDILALVTAGEFMQPVRAVRHYGVDFMESIRKMELPRFAEGGMVGPTSGSARSGAVVTLDLRMNGGKLGRFTGSDDDVRALVNALTRLEQSVAGDGG